MNLIVQLTPLLAMLVIAALIDLKSRRIPNWLTLVCALSGLGQALVYGVPTSFSGALLGLVVGFFILIIPFALGAMGGGDVKLMAGVGAWLGAVAALQVFAVSAIVGLIIVILQAILTGRLTKLVRNSTVIVANFANYAQVGRDNVVATGQAMKSVDKPLPYAVPILAGVVFTIAMNLR